MKVLIFYLFAKRCDRLDNSKFYSVFGSGYVIDHAQNTCRTDEKRQKREKLTFDFDRYDEQVNSSYRYIVIMRNQTFLIL